MVAIATIVAAVMWVGTAPRSHAEIDVRVDGVLLAQGSTSASYIVHIDDCTSLTRVTITSGATVLNRTRTDVRAVPGSSGCELHADFANQSNASTVSVAAYFEGVAAPQTAIETFVYEERAPELAFDSVSFTDLGGRQHLVVALTAFDTTDLSYVAVSAVGLRASDLRQAGGIVAVARRSAFAESEGMVRLVPSSDQQTRFALPIAVSTALTPAEIASNGLVLVEAIAVDASGNQSSFSKIVFTGGDVNERAEGLSVQPTALVFTNALQTAAVVPTVQYQFRGATPLPGGAGGVSFVSATPNVVRVTSAGIVYPAPGASSGDEGSITVSYPGIAESISVPVKLDYSARLTGLRVETPTNKWVLPRLNTWTALPKVWAVLAPLNAGDPVREIEIGSQFPIELIPSPNAEGLVELDVQRGARASQAIAETSPVTVVVRLRDANAISTEVSLAALDASPTIRLAAPAQAMPGQRIELSPDVSDDTRVVQVRYKLGGIDIGARDTAPFALTIGIEESMLNSTLQLEATAVDEVG